MFCLIPDQLFSILLTEFFKALLVTYSVRNQKYIVIISRFILLSPGRIGVVELCTLFVELRTNQTL